MMFQDEWKGTFTHKNDTVKKFAINISQTFLKTFSNISNIE